MGRDGVIRVNKDGVIRYMKVIGVFRIRPFVDFQGGEQKKMGVEA